MEHSSMKHNSPNGTSCSSSTNSNGVQPVTRSDPNNPYPTTFVQADTSSFKQVVQLLTGSSETVKIASTHKPGSDLQPVTKNPIPPRRPQAGFKLYERRNSIKNFKISPLLAGFNRNSSVSSPNYSGFSPRHKQEILSPSMLNFPSLVLSPVTPLMNDPFNRSRVEEERAIAEKGFYLHKSPSTTPRDSEPRLLPLFPVTSPRVSGSDHS